MGSYITLTMSTSLFSDIMYNLQECVHIKEGYSEIEDLVHVIDVLEELERDYHLEENAKYIRERELMNTFGDESVEDYNLARIVMDELDNLIPYTKHDDKSCFRDAMFILNGLREKYDLVEKPVNEPLHIIKQY